MPHWRKVNGRISQKSARTAIRRARRSSLASFLWPSGTSRLETPLWLEAFSTGWCTTLTDPLGLANEGAANSCEPYGSCPQTCDPSLNMDCIPGCSYYDPTCSQGCVLDSMSMPCQEIALLMPSGSTFECPDGGCWQYGTDPYTGAPAFIDFTEDAAGNSGYLSTYDWTQGVNGIDGTFVSNAEFSALEAAAVGAQEEALAVAISRASRGKIPVDQALSDLTYIKTTGGHANFAWSGGVSVLQNFLPNCTAGGEGSNCRVDSMPSIHWHAMLGEDPVLHFDAGDPFWGFGLGLIVHVGDLLGMINSSVPFGTGGY